MPRERRCGHPRTPENTRYGGRCRTCYRVRNRRDAAAWKARNPTKVMLNSHRAERARQDAKDAAMIEWIDQQLTRILRGA